MIDESRTYELDRAHVFHSWSAQGALNPMVVTRAEGSTVWDDQGTSYLDFSSQLVFTNIGHQHPKVVAAIQAQAAQLCTIAPGTANAARSEAARLIAGLAPDGLEKVFFTNGGADADRARHPDGPAAHRPDQGALDVPLLPRWHGARGQRDRRPAAVAERPRQRRHGALLRAVPLPQRVQRDHRGGGVRARARPPRAGHRARGRRSPSPRSSSSRSPAPPASCCRRPATCRRPRRSATSTASSTSPTR